MRKDFDKEAAAWVVREKDGLSEREHREFLRWCEQDSRTQAALIRARRTWARFDGLEGSDEFDHLLDAEKRTGPNWLYWAGAAALILLSCWGLTWSWSQSPVNPAESTHGAPTVATWNESDWIELQDKSTIELNTGAQVAYVYSDYFRTVWVQSGEAFFTVAHDPGRPFVVFAGNTRTEAVGTQFNVKLESHSVEVLVREGKVLFSAVNGIPDESESSGAGVPEALLRTNQKAVVVDSEETADSIVIQEITDAEIQETIAWKPVTLRFDSEPLAEVVAEFNRYNKQQVEIADPEITNLRIVAKFRSNNLRGFLRLLEMTSGITSELEGDTIRLHAASTE